MAYRVPSSRNLETRLVVSLWQSIEIGPLGLDHRERSVMRFSSGAASTETPCSPLGTHELVQPLRRQVELRAWLPLSLTHRLSRLPLDLRSIRPSNPRHGPLTALSRAFAASQK